jgi:hypothetical protein
MLVEESLAMDRAPEIPRLAALAVVVLSVGALGDTCHTRSPTPDESASLQDASKVATPEPAPAGGQSASPAGAPPKPPAAEPLATAAPDAPTFEATVRPILTTRCAPCHNPGGVMYGRLPFDQAAVVSSNAAGIRRRLKGDDLAALEKWLATLPPSESSEEPWEEKPGAESGTSGRD